MKWRDPRIGQIVALLTDTIIPMMSNLNRKVDVMSQTFSQDLEELMKDVSDNAAAVADNTAAVNQLVQSLGNTPTPDQLQQVQQQMAALESQTANLKATTAAAVSAGGTSTPPPPPAPGP